MALPEDAPPDGGPPDAALVARVRLGERNAYAALVRRHQGAVRALLRRLCKGDAALADDLAQEAFLQAWRKLDQFRGEARFSTWIYRIAYNAFLMHARVQRPEQALDESKATGTQRHESAGEGAAAAIGEAAAAELSADLQRALAKLSDAERAAIVQCYYLDRSHEEAAYVLGCPLGTVKSHLARAKHKLKAQLHAWDPER
jgi:RNA polymerase sigma factor (sigma-70 family)